MAGPDGWISSDDLHRALDAAGHPTPARRLELWRYEGLLPDVMQGGGVWHPPSTLDQVVAIHRIKETKNRTDFIGPVLWAAGYQVDDRHWRDGLRKADRTGHRIVSILAYLTERSDRSDTSSTLGERAAGQDKLSGIAAKVRRRLDGAQWPAAVGTMLDVAMGQFNGFEYLPDGKEGVDIGASITSGFGFDGGSQHHVYGKRLTLGAALEPMLKDISASITQGRLEDFSAEEIKAARDDVRNGLKLGLAFYEAMAWVYGDKAFGLKLLAYLARTGAAHSIFAATLAFARLRRVSKDLLPSETIAALARQAEASMLISSHLRDLHRTRPEYGEIFSPARLREAFSDVVQRRRFESDLSGVQIPMPEFRPWNAWQETSAKRVPPGVLAIAAMAPERASLTQVLRGAGGEIDGR